MKHFTNTAIIALCICMFAVLPVSAQAEIRSGEEFCLGKALSENADGVFISSAPEENRCLLLLGERVIRTGDFLPEEALERLVLRPVQDEVMDVSVGYMPIRDGKLSDRSVFTMHVRSSRNEPPAAEDLELETYKNIPNVGKLSVTNDDDGKLTYQLVSRPKYGTAELREDGSFLYTPKKNKVGQDSFTYTVTDESGSVSNEATVRIRILQPLDNETFDDLSSEAQFTALWLRDNGLFGGELIADRLCFCPEKTVTRGEFLCMAMQLGEIDPEIGLLSSGFTDQSDAAEWMQPYLVCAMRRGIVKGFVTEAGVEFRPNEPVTQRQAAMMLVGAMRLDTSRSVFADRQDVPAWASTAVGALAEEGISCGENAPLTRQAAARLLYQASKLKA